VIHALEGRPFGLEVRWDLAQNFGEYLLGLVGGQLEMHVASVVRWSVLAG
jgi:hypothetical protein